MNNKYTGVLIFLVSILIVGGIYLFASKKSNNQTLQSAVPSATIEASAAPTASASANKNMFKVTELKIEDEKIGTGVEAVTGKKITVNYTGTLTDGTPFDSNVDPNFGHLSPFVFTLGAGNVIEGWDKGFAGMKVGGKRKLTIPSSMAYGDAGVSGAIPGGATLIFEVELLNVE